MIYIRLRIRLLYYFNLAFHFFHYYVYQNADNLYIFIDGVANPQLFSFFYMYLFSYPIFIAKHFYFYYLYTY